MRYRDSAEGSRLMTPGQVYTVRIDLAASSNVSGRAPPAAGSCQQQLRALGPQLNVNTGEDQGSSIRMAKALNTVYHDHEHNSSLISPMIPL